MSQKINKDPLIIVDVGAAGGLNSKWNTVKHKAILFDANPNAQIKDNKEWLVIKTALSDSQDTKTLFVTRKPTNSSLYEPNIEFLKKFPSPERFEVQEKISIFTDTLDSQLSKHAILDADHIKLDVQGHELAVLKGATNILTNIVSIETEFMFAPMYLNQPLFSELDGFLRKNGFELANFLHLESWKRNDSEYLIWGEAFYVKDAANLSPVKREKLNVIKDIILKKHSVIKLQIKNNNVNIKNIKKLIKKFFISLGLLHPAKGVKISPTQKSQIILEHKNNLNCFVETGTHSGDMIERVGSEFKKIFSVELDQQLYEAAKEKFKNNNNIKLYFGDSATEIRTILKEISEPALFWLDAHGNGEITATNSPIMSELKEIFNHPVKNHTILIDDARHFDWHIIKNIKKMAKNWNYIFLIKDGIFRLYEKKS